LKLLLDEHLSPKLAVWCAERRGIHAVPVAHVGLAGRSDAAVWAYASMHDLVVVTTNARDFLGLLDIELHPGLIVLRESGLSRQEQWARLETVLDHLHQMPDPATHMVNRVVELWADGRLLSREIPYRAE
jgi:predicted nuclease of predicted toxin-antitoxin system